MSFDKSYKDKSKASMINFARANLDILGYTKQQFNRLCKKQHTHTYWKLWLEDKGIYINCETGKFAHACRIVKQG